MTKFFSVVVTLAVLLWGGFQANAGERTDETATEKFDSGTNKNLRSRNKSQSAATGSEHKKKNTENGQTVTEAKQGGGKSHKHKHENSGQTQAAEHSGRKGKAKGKGNQPNPTPVPWMNYQLSDLRAKNHISFVGWSPMGIPIYRFSYISEPNKRYQGTIAQAITRIRPEAVINRDGFLFVDYSQIDVEMEELPQASVSAGKTD